MKRNLLGLRLSKRCLWLYITGNRQQAWWLDQVSAHTRNDMSPLIFPSLQVGFSNGWESFPQDTFALITVKISPQWSGSQWQLYPINKY